MTGSLLHISFDELAITKTIDWTQSGNFFYDAAFIAKYKGSKVMLLEMTEDNLARQALAKKTGEPIQELRLNSTTLNHPHILKTIGYTKLSTGVYYLVVEYFGEMTLSHYLQTHKLAPKKVMKLAGKLADALGYLHCNGIIHSDVATCNILIDHKKNIKLFNFALSSHVGDTKILSESSGFGHERSLSPETYLYNKQSSKSDIWQLGILMYELATKEQLFSSVFYSSEAFLNMMTRKEFPAPRHQLPEILFELIQRCCCFEHEIRLSSDSVKAFCEIKHRM